MKKNIFSVSLIAMLAVAPFAGAMADVTPTKVLATTSYVQGAYEAANDYTDNQINALNATVSQTAVTGGDGLNLSITETGGVITSISGSIDANTYDAYGAAAAVKDDVEDGTIVAAKATADANGNEITATYATKTALENLAQGTNSAIGGLDANKSQTAGVDGLALNIVEEDGVITSISGSIATGTYATKTEFDTATTALQNSISDTATGLSNAVTTINGSIDNLSTNTTVALANKQNLSDSTVAAGTYNVIAEGAGVASNLVALDSAVGALGAIVVADTWNSDNTTVLNPAPTVE